MKLGTFTFPNEPETLRIGFLRNVKIDTEKSWDVIDNGRQGRIFDCEGIFCSNACYLYAKNLSQIFAAGQAVTFSHEKWGDASVLLTELQIDEACKTDFLRYRFRLVELPPQAN